MARLLEQAVALGLRLLQLCGRVGVGLREQLARLVPRGVQHLRALALALLAVALDLGLARPAARPGGGAPPPRSCRAGRPTRSARRARSCRRTRRRRESDGARPSGRRARWLDARPSGLPPAAPGAAPAAARRAGGKRRRLRERAPSRGRPRGREGPRISAGSSATGLLPGLGLRLPSVSSSRCLRVRARRAFRKYDFSIGGQGPALDSGCAIDLDSELFQDRVRHRGRRARQRVASARRPSGTRSPGGGRARRPCARRSGRCPSRSRRAAERRASAPRAGSRTSPAAPPRRCPSSGRPPPGARRRWIRIEPEPSSQPFQIRS